MFNAVMGITLRGQTSCDKLIAYAASVSLPIWPAFEQLYDLITKNYDETYLSDITNAVNISSAIDNYLP